MTEVATKLRVRSQAVIGIAMIITLVAVLLGTYQKVFTKVVTVTVETDRAGLLLDKGSAVRAFGVPVGEVRSTKVVDGHTASVTIALDTSEARHIPNNVTASIDATTVFGAKFVNLAVPTGPVSQPIRSGDTIQATSTTVEINDVFQHALEVIDTVKPAELNTTLTSMASALNGRGEKLGELLSASNDYLTQFNDHLPAVSSDVQQANGVLKTYADVAPNLLNVADHATTTSKTLRTNQADLDMTLRDVSSASGTIGDFLEDIEKPLVSALTRLTPVTSLLNRYEPELPCIISGLASHNKRISSAFGAQEPGSQALSGFLPAQNPYTYPKDLPKLASGVGPKCYSYPDKEGGTFTHVEFDDGSAGTYTTDKGLDFSNPLKLYPDVAGSFLGQSGFAALLDSLRQDAPNAGAAK